MKKLSKETKNLLTALLVIVGGYVLVGSVSACNNVNVITGILVFTVIAIVVALVIAGVKLLSDKDKLYDFFN